MDSIYESPWPGIVLGGLLAVMLLAGYLQTGRRALLIGALAALLLGLLLLVVERQVETPREQVESRVHSLADALENNRDREILSAIHSQAAEIKRRAAAELQLYEFTEVDVKGNLKVEVSEDQPPRAVATFNVVARLEQYPRPIPRFIKLTFYREPDGVWRISDYVHQPPQMGFQKSGEEP